MKTGDTPRGGVSPEASPVSASSSGGRGVFLRATPHQQQRGQTEQSEQKRAGLRDDVAIIAVVLALGLSLGLSLRLNLELTLGLGLRLLIDQRGVEVNDVALALIGRLGLVLILVAVLVAGGVALSGALSGAGTATAAGAAPGAAAGAE